MLSNLVAHGKIPHQSFETQRLMSRIALNLGGTASAGAETPSHAGAAIYSHRNERFSATIRPFAISRHRQAITLPSSK